MVDRSADAKSVGGHRFVCMIGTVVTAKNVRDRKFVFTSIAKNFARTARDHIYALTFGSGVSVSKAHSSVCMSG